VTYADPFPDTPVAETIALPAGFNNVLSFRFGAEYQLNDLLAVRAGGFYETASLSDQRISVAIVDSTKKMGAGGFSLFLPGDRFVVDAYGSLVFFADLSIRDSTVTQINVYDVSNQGTVGNGDITSRGFAFGAAGRVLFGKPTVP
jgi:long-subunit fatty acid transport protein